MAFLGGTSRKGSSCQCWKQKRGIFDPRAGKIPWRRKWQPTPVFLPGKSQGQRSWWATVHGASEHWTRLSVHVRAHTHTHTHTRTHGHVSINLYLQKRKWSESHSVMSDSLWPCGLYSPWTSPGQNTGVGSLFLLQGILPIQGLNPGLPHCRQILCQLSHHGSQKKRSWGHIWPRGHCLPRLDLK